MTTSATTPALYDTIPNINTAAETAEHLRIPVRRVMNLCRDGKLQAFKINATWLITKEAIIELLERGRNDVRKNTSPDGSFDAFIEDIAAIRAQLPEPAQEPLLDMFDRPIRRRRGTS